MSGARSRPGTQPSKKRAPRLSDPRRLAEQREAEADPRPTSWAAPARRLIRTTTNQRDSGGSAVVARKDNFAGFDASPDLQANAVVVVDDSAGLEAGVDLQGTKRL